MHIIIIDDEKIAALALQKLVQDYCNQNQISLNCQVFENAQDALSYISSCEIKPDILFTDIRMPGMDGLDLTHNLMSEYPDLLIVIISGYSDFNYSQTALKYKAFDYLLKPIYRQQIYECMDNLCGKLKQNISNQQEISYLKNQALFSQMIFDDTYDLNQLSKTISIDSSASYISMIFLHKSVEFTSNEKEIILSFAQNHVTRLPIESPNHKDIFILNLYYLDNINNIRVVQQNYCKSIYAKLIEYMDSNTFSITTSEIAPSSSPFQALYLQCYYSSKEHMLTSDSPSSNTVAKGEKNYISPYSARLEYEILKSFDFKNPLLTKQLFKNAILNLTSKENISLWSLSDLISFFVIVLNKKIYKYNETHNSSHDYISETKISNFETIESIEDFFNGQIERIYAILQGNTTDASQDTVNIMVNYIHENFFLDITLQDIASNILYMHPSYLSRLFKSKLNISFSKYLLQYRLEVSKKMLLEYRSTSIAEIASLCGFSDCSYYVKQFKAAYNITPNFYRNQKLQ